MGTRWDLDSSAQLMLLDSDGDSAPIDGTLETGKYTLEVEEPFNPYIGDGAPKNSKNLLKNDHGTNPYEMQDDDTKKAAKSMSSNPFSQKDVRDDFKSKLSL